MRALLPCLLALLCLSSPARAQNEWIPVDFPFSYVGDLENDGVPYDGPLFVRLEPIGAEAANVEEQVQVVRGRFTVDGILRHQAPDRATGPLRIRIGIRLAGQPWTWLDPPQVVHPAPYATTGLAPFAIDRMSTLTVSQNSEIAQAEVGSLRVTTFVALSTRVLEGTGAVTLRGRLSSNFLEYAPLLPPDNVKVLSTVTARTIPLPNPTTHFCFLSEFSLSGFAGGAPAAMDLNCSVVVQGGQQSLVASSSPSQPNAARCAATCVRFANGGIAP